jgi:hypothetical protein
MENRDVMYNAAIIPEVKTIKLFFKMLSELKRGWDE